ncbi:MAG: NAD(P)-binding domain-containing protein, partial [Marinovum sp.]|nr:NAD(P)-binding domain-containing protein [Marinovum sp.]
MEKPINVALLGTGLMGFPMAQNILKTGHNVTVWNRSSGKAEPLLDFGAKIAQTPTDAIDGAEVII